MQGSLQEEYQTFASTATASVTFAGCCPFSKLQEVSQTEPIPYVLGPDSMTKNTPFQAVELFPLSDSPRSGLNLAKNNASLIVGRPGLLVLCVLQTQALTILPDWSGCNRMLGTWPR